MSDNKKNSCKTAIGCDAANCEYNEHGTGCSADHIRVDGRNAHRTGETGGSTFKQKGSAKFGPNL